MRVLRRIGRVGLTIGAAAALVTGLTANAQAASGTLFYTRADTGFKEPITDPDNDDCLPLDGGALLVDNETDAIATVFRDDSCSTPQASLHHGETGAFGGATVPHSVVFTAP
ncbi:hypothetical protein [Streptomyces blastmyceticus]|uniref:Secreted protein n=1 Tax=Streptomyces blastmyceticus TaxID=68180 RepID=A0ABP3G633_9ACTN